MTREDAIDIIKSECYVFNPLNFDRSTIVNTALDMAIKALEQEPCEDCISRSEALKVIEEQKQGFYGVERYAIDEAHSAVMKLPSVTPQPITLEKAIDYLHEIGWMQEHDKEMAQARWIPVSERLPEVGSEVLVCFDFKGNRSVYISDFYGDGKFHGLDDEYLTSEGRKYRKAVAWMPLPEVYRGEEAET